jgi:hypothetical protein
MSLRRVMVLFLIPAASLLAQLVNNTVTATASQSSTAAQPDEAVFSVAVASVGVGTSLDQVVAAVSGLGITAANLVQISNAQGAIIFSPTPPQSSPAPALPLNWIFQLVVPFSMLKDTTGALAALQKSISQNNSGLTLSFTLSGTRVSGQQAPNCNLADLVSQARAQAQDIAGASGFKAGAIVGLTSATSAAVPICSLTVRFALGAMFGQPEPIITITATRTNAIQPDEVLIGLTVQSRTTSGLDDIIGALTAAGISGTNFTSVYTTNIYPPTNNPQTALVWSFTLTAPLAKLSSALSQVLSAQQTISANESGLTLAFYVEGMQVSQQLLQSQPCSQAALLADAQAQAKRAATAAGVSAGAILSMSEGISGAAGLQLVPAYQPVPANLVVGNFGYTSFATSNVFTTPQPTCSLTIQFQLM